MASDEMTEVTSKSSSTNQETLDRQSSVYSLTLDEIQNSLCEPGRNFGSMNMDDFLASIWTDDAGPVAAPQIHRQGSITLPTPLSGKTVEEVWAHIHRSHPHPNPNPQSFTTHAPPPPPVSLQPTFGEMTLEDFLVKAGVVREGAAPPSHAPTEQAMVRYQVGQGYDFAYGGHANVVGNGYGVAVKEATSDEEAAEEGVVDEMGRDGGTKRKADGTVEKVVVERRQRRMIKNRESAARSRARKQAYTVELEAELNILKDQNSRLKEEQMRMMALRVQMLLDAMDRQARANLTSTNRKLRRCRSW